MKAPRNRRTRPSTCTPQRTCWHGTYEEAGGALACRHTFEEEVGAAVRELEPGNGHLVGESDGGRARGEVDDPHRLGVEEVGEALNGRGLSSGGGDTARAVVLGGVLGAPRPEELRDAVLRSGRGTA